METYPRAAVERLMTIPALGPITALTWPLEFGDAKRFSSISFKRHPRNSTASSPRASFPVTAAETAHKRAQ